MSSVLSPRRKTPILESRPLVAIRPPGKTWRPVFSILPSQIRSVMQAPGFHLPRPIPWSLGMLMDLRKHPPRRPNSLLPMSLTIIRQLSLTRHLRVKPKHHHQQQFRVLKRQNCQRNQKLEKELPRQSRSFAQRGDVERLIKKILTKKWSLVTHY